MDNPWLFDASALANTPSRRDGISSEAELQLRREGVRLIMDVGGELKLYALSLADYGRIVDC